VDLDQLVREAVGEVVEVGELDVGEAGRGRAHGRTVRRDALTASVSASPVSLGPPTCHADAVPLALPPSDPCSFCDYLAGTRSYTILDRDDLTAMLVTYEQRGRGHVLVIPVRHRLTVLDLSAAERAAVMDGVVRAVDAITKAFDPEGVAVWQNNGIPAHQSVPHVHFHVAGTLPQGGTIWGAVEQLDIATTDGIAAQLRPHLLRHMP
jgi:histidine triad (HIT) family protein